MHNTLHLLDYQVYNDSITKIDYQQKQLKEYKQWIFKSRGGREKNLILNTLKEVFVNLLRG